MRIGIPASNNPAAAKAGARRESAIGIESVNKGCSFLFDACSSRLLRNALKLTSRDSPRIHPRKIDMHTPAHFLHLFGEHSQLLKIRIPQ